MPLTSTAADTTYAVQRMCAVGVAALVVLGGDGTHRVVAKACGDVPICALSTGTNNVFPEMRETTVAGIATGLVATGQAGAEALRRTPALVVERRGAPRDAEPDLALVDVAVTRERFVGARALWRHEALVELFVTIADPGAVGLSAVAGMLAPGSRGLHVLLAPDSTQAQVVLDVALAPGLVAPVAVAAFGPLQPGERVALAANGASLALDGEREIERHGDDSATVHLADGPLRIDVDAVMAEHAARVPRAAE